MTVGNAMRDMIEDMMLSAYITSPRFDDYEIDAVEIPPAGIENLIDSEIRKIIEEQVRTQSREPSSSYDAHIQSYGRFKREEDSDNIDDIMGMMQGGKQLFTNPSGFILSKMTAMLPVLAPLLLAAMLPQIIESVIETLTRPGFPLDPRFTRFMEQEWNTGLERQTQFNAMIGRRNVVIQTKAGWRNQMGAGHTSIYKRIAEGTGVGPRLGTVLGMPEKSTGSGGRQ